MICVHPDPGSNNNKKEEGEKFVVLPFFWQKFHKIVNYFEKVPRTEKDLNQLTKILIVFIILTQKIVTKLSDIWGWDPRSGIWKKLIQIPDPGSRGQKSTGSWIRIRNTDGNSYVYRKKQNQKFWGISSQVKPQLSKKPLLSKFRLKLKL
jgi:hypothetical protein